MHIELCNHFLLRMGALSSDGFHLIQFEEGGAANAKFTFRMAKSAGEEAT